MSKKKLKPPGAMEAVITGMFRGQLINSLLIAGVMLSAFTLIITSHEQRQQYAKLENLQQNRDQLDVEWRRLRLEQRVMAEHSRLEQLASKKLGMKNLDLKSERIVRRISDGE
ncbi:MAG: cell division protein FtsL [Gammaproteobacteria bacterium]|nr:MAG: cell division protein FtsL [Gammaproteobacteria bacterium]